MFLVLIGFIIAAFVGALCFALVYDRFVDEVGVEADTSTARPQPSYADIVAGSPAMSPSMSASQSKGSEKKKHRQTTKATKNPSYAEIVKRGVLARMQDQGQQPKRSTTKPRRSKPDKDGFTVVHHSAASNRRFSQSQLLAPQSVSLSNSFDLLPRVAPSKLRRHKPKRRQQGRHMNAAEETSLIGWTTAGLKKKRWHRPLRPEVMPILRLFNEFSALSPTNDHKKSWNPTTVASPEDIMPSPTHQLSTVMLLCILCILMISNLALIPVYMDIVGDTVAYQLMALSLFESMLFQLLYKLVSRKVFVLCKKMQRIIQRLLSRRKTVKKVPEFRRRVQVSRLRRPRRHYQHRQQSSSRHDAERSSHCKLSL